MTRLWGLGSGRTSNNGLTKLTKELASKAESQIHWIKIYMFTGLQVIYVQLTSGKHCLWLLIWPDTCQLCEIGCMFNSSIPQLLKLQDRLITRRQWHTHVKSLVQ
jgi:hypothetical protein